MFTQLYSEGISFTRRWNPLLSNKVSYEKIGIRYVMFRQEMELYPIEWLFMACAIIDQGWQQHQSKLAYDGCGEWWYMGIKSTSSL